MKDGFVTALGTPLDDSGALVESSFVKHVEDQIACGASALLVMGTMGNEAYIRDSVYPVVARAAMEAARGRVPVLVGAMDNSIGRVRDRIDSLRGLEIDGIVTTTPFYLKATQSELLEFFRGIAETSPFPVYLYDLWVVTQTKIEVETVFELMSDDNIRGIKSGDLLTCKFLQFDPRRKSVFDVMFSGLDAFDIAYSYGVRSNLDGMFSCTPSINTKMYDALQKGDIDGGRKHLADILELRNTFISVGVMKGFTVAMNLLGYEGSFAPDYVVPATGEESEAIRACMKRIGLL